MTKSKWFVPLLLAVATVLIAGVYMYSTSHKSKTPPPTTTTTISTTSVKTTPIATVTLPAVTLPQTTIVSTITEPAVTLPAVTHTAISTTTQVISTTLPAVTLPATTITPTPVTTTVAVTTVTTPLLVTTTVTTPVTSTTTTTVTPTTTVTTTTTTTMTATTTPTTTVTTTLPATTVTTTVAPSMTFTTGLAVDGTTLTGQNLSTGFTITTHGNASVSHILTLSGATISVPLAVNCPFTLQATSPQKTSLLTYFGNMGGNPVYTSQIVNEVNGNVPFFYLDTSNDLVDGFKYALGISPTLLTINDNYPIGTYTYTGTLLGTNNAVLHITITLIVQ